MQQIRKAFYGVFFSYGAVRFSRTAPHLTVLPLTKPHRTAPYRKIIEKSKPHRTAP